MTTLLFTYKVELEIDDITVDTKYFSFNYELRVNNILVATDCYDSDFSFWSKEDFTHLLKTSRAAELVLERHHEDIINYKDFDPSNV